MSFSRFKTSNLHESHESTIQNSDRQNARTPSFSGFLDKGIGRIRSHADGVKIRSPLFPTASRCPSAE
jgi:hypothetical protein